MLERLRQGVQLNLYPIGGDYYIKMPQPKGMLPDCPHEVIKHQGTVVCIYHINTVFLRAIGSLMIYQQLSDIQSIDIFQVNQLKRFQKSYPNCYAVIFTDLKPEDYV